MMIIRNFLIPIAGAICFLLPQPIKAQQAPYTSDWKKVDSLSGKGLTKSALEVVNSIYQRSKKTGNNVQVIKALVYQVTLENNISSDSIPQRIQNIETEIATVKEPAKSILNSLAATMYWQYFQQQRYRIYNRTNTTDFDKADIDTWTIEDFNQKISKLYLASIEQKNLLRNTTLEKFEPIIIKGNVRKLRPTLYDLLANRALEYFSNDERDITRPAYAFVINDPVVFAPAEQFIKHQFVTSDTASSHHKALQIYQDLLRLHLTDAEPGAFIDADLSRLGFANQYARVDKKDSLYLRALAHLANSFPKVEMAAEADLIRAQIIFQGSSQQPRGLDTSKIYSPENAKQIADSIARAFPGSDVAKRAKSLADDITYPSLRLTSEKVNVPGLPFRTLVTYRNVSSIQLRLIKLTEALRKQIRNNDDNDKLFRNLLSQNVIKEWMQKLPASEDFKEHSVEIKVDALPVGEYLLLSGPSQSLSINSNPLVAQSFFVSNISFISKGNEYLVLDRTSGEALPGANIRVWKELYNYNNGKYSLSLQETLAADRNGYAKIGVPEDNQQGNIRIAIDYKKDHFFPTEPQYSIYYNRNRQEDDYADQEEYDDDNARIFLFTDRSIYRPGQDVYFKGIGITRHWKTNQPILLQQKDSIEVMLSDANHQNVDSMKVKLSDFGSFSGKFKIPEGRLTGEYNLDVYEYNNSSISFSVEEYKRPKFYADIDSLGKTYRVGDTVTITGTAKAYAGNNISGAKVVYRVERVARFLYPWMFWKISFPRTQPQEIAHGEAQTDESGKFQFNFPAIPDLSLDKNTDPVFDYKVTVDVTDINGETRSTELTVPVGYKALNLQIKIPSEVIVADSLRDINVTSENLSGKPEDAVADLKIFRLETPLRLIRPRYWETPDQFIYSKEEFIRLFPNDEYKEELQKETWAKGAMLFNMSDSTNSKFKIQNSKFSPGWYVIEATAKDRYGQEVKDVKYFQIIDPQGEALGTSDYLLTHLSKTVATPGEHLEAFVATAAGKINLIYETDHVNNFSPSEDQEETELHFATIERTKVFRRDITEKDRGGFGANFFFVKDNRLFTSYNEVFVPWTNKQLDISFETFRDKTLPGSEEKWKVKICGDKKEKVAAEMLVSMYDASLDQFESHDWTLPSVWPVYDNYQKWDGALNFTDINSFEKYQQRNYPTVKEKIYDQLIFTTGYNYRLLIRGASSVAAPAPADLQGKVAGIPVQNAKLDEVVVAGYGRKKEMAESLGNVVAYSIAEVNQGEEKPKQPNPSPIQIRKNLQETAFFYPELHTDKDGNVEFSFTMPEALTQWKLMAFAHTKDLATGYTEKSVITQKDLMVQPNAPRFFREGDSISFSAKIVNVSDKDLKGVAEFHLLNASTMNPVDSWFQNNNPISNFDVKAGGSSLVTFKTIIPHNFNDAVVYRIVAKANNVSDGEEAPVAVVTNRMLVTESLPLAMNGNGSRNFTFDRLLHSAESKTLTNYALTVEYTPNPAWYVVQALSYLMEYPYECAEQTFNRYLANALATKIVSASPRLKSIFEKWATEDTAALFSNLQKNEELKSVLLEETPWVLQAKNEEAQKKNIALLFDFARMGLKLQATLDKLEEMQVSNGGFVWFKGGRDDRYMTQYITTGIGHLMHLSAVPENQKMQINQIISTAIPYLDKKISDDYQELIRHKSNLGENNLSSIAIQYLYMRSFFRDIAFGGEAKTAFKYYRDQVAKYWLKQSRYMQGMIALAEDRFGNHQLAAAIIRSLKENAIVSEDLGMYWKEWEQRGYWWYQAPVESQALMIEAFSEVTKDLESVNKMKTWLLKNKQTNNWETTKATAEACYAFLLQGADVLVGEKNVVIKTGDVTVSTSTEKTEAGTGYFKRKIDGNQVKPAMGNISVTVNDKATSTKPETPSWGAIYWQYFEDLDKISFAETQLKLSKKLFIETNSDRGPILTPVAEGQLLDIGDKIKVRIELRVDREMEYVHMKDMRASCMEPTNVLSQYKYQDGLGYYESTKDVSTNFFFDHLYKGTYVFEYPMFVTHSGNFSNGITTIQCMYAPEFTAHSEGIRVRVE